VERTLCSLWVHPPHVPVFLAPSQHVKTGQLRTGEEVRNSRASVYPPRSGATVPSGDEHIPPVYPAGLLHAAEDPALTVASLPNGPRCPCSMAMATPRPVKGPGVLPCGVLFLGGTLGGKDEGQASAMPMALGQGLSPPRGAAWCPLTSPGES
jgi:hypothetical protein